VKQREFLLNLRDHLQNIKNAPPIELKSRLEMIENLVDWQLLEPEEPPICGLYLSDMSRLYGFSFPQLKHLVAECLKDKRASVEKPNAAWGLRSLLQWLYEVSHTSIGDIHGDLIKDVQITFLRPEDLTSEQELEYDQFWKDVTELISLPDDVKNRTVQFSEPSPPSSGPVKRLVEWITHAL